MRNVVSILLGSLGLLGVLLGVILLYGGMSRYVIPPDGKLPADVRLAREWDWHVHDQGDFKAGLLASGIGASLLVGCAVISRRRGCSTTLGR